MQYVEVAVNLPPVRGTFHYHLPPELEGRVAPGHLVTVSFGRRRVQGLVVGRPETPEVPETLPIESIVDPLPVLTPPQLELARWLARTYRAAPIECLTVMLPPGLSRPADMLYELTAEPPAGLDPTQDRLVTALRTRGPLHGRQIERLLPRRRWRPAAEALVRAGVLSRRPVLDPPRVRPRRVRTARLAVPPPRAAEAVRELRARGRPADIRRAAALQVVLGEDQPVEATWVYAESAANLQDLYWLEKNDLLALGEAEIWRDPLEAVEYVPSEAPELTPDQAAAWQVLEGELRRAAAGLAVPPALLHGVTGSGKTEIYLRAVAETLRLGRRALVLVPEIALTPQTVRRFLARFPGRVGLLHSGLSDGERYDTWRRCRGGLLDVLIGPRSALFAPLAGLGLIVLDEAHDDSYKEGERAPRHDARAAAEAYAGLLPALCILGTATPDVVALHRAGQGALRLLRLPQRILSHPLRLDGQARRLGVQPPPRAAQGPALALGLPPVRVVDMRLELKSGNRSLFSRALQQALAETLAAGQQAILFLNRRGTASFVFCRDCGTAARCPRCEAPLTYHGAHSALLCHHCGHQRRPLRRCPACGSERIRHFGAGTQRIQSELEALHPGVQALRWDRDTTRAAGAHDVLLAHFAARRADVLIGTQMVAKGLDLPLVTLVGVISADTALHLPDYRAAERTFQLLTQVAGRAGRGLLGGRVIVQTFHPDHYAIRAAAAHDLETFYDEEIAQRLRLSYPPFTRLARLVLRLSSESRARAEAERLAGALRRQLENEGHPESLIGPAPCYHRRLRGDFRWQIVLRGPCPAEWIPQPLPEAWTVDIDPVSLL